MTIISRSQLDHPDLATTGGVTLHDAITAIYEKLGDNANSRFFTQDALNDAAFIDFNHNFKSDFTLLAYKLFLRNTGTGELTELNEDSSPPITDFTIEPTPSFETTIVRVTNNSGAARDIALVIAQNAMNLAQIRDYDTTTPPEDGQTVVYDATTKTYKPGASGDASFKIQSVTDPNAVIKSGFLILDDGRELAISSDLTIDLDTVFGGLPAASTSYYLYVDLLQLPAQSLLGANNREVYLISSESEFHLDVRGPQDMDMQFYVPIGIVTSDGSQDWDTFETLAFRRHDTDQNKQGVQNLFFNPKYERNLQGVSINFGTATFDEETTDPLEGERSLKIQFNGSPSEFAIQLNSTSKWAVDNGILHEITTAIQVPSGISEGDIQMRVYNSTKAVDIDSTIVDLIDGQFYYNVNLIPNPNYWEFGDILELVIEDIVGVNDDMLLDSHEFNYNKKSGSSSYIGPWQSYTPTLTNIPSVSTNTAFFRRNGESMEIQGRFRLSSTPTGTVELSLPSGYTIDFTSVAASTGLDGVVGPADWYDSSVSQNKFLAVAIISTTNNTFRFDEGGAINFGANGATGDQIGYKFSIPIAEWKGQGITNTINDSLINSNSKIKLNGLTTGTIASGKQTVPYDSATLEYQTGLTTSSSVVVIDADGIYDINAYLNASSALTANLTMFITKNGSTDIAVASYVSGGERNAKINGKFKLFKGETVEIKRDSTVTAYATADNECWFEVTRWADISTGSPVGFGLATDVLAGLLRNYELVEISLDGDFTTGTLRILKIGSLVIITLKETFASHASGSTINSSASLVPTRFRPNTNLSNVYYDAAALIARVFVGSSGVFQTEYRDWTGATVNASSTQVSPTIAYLV